VHTEVLRRNTARGYVNAAMRRALRGNVEPALRMVQVGKAAEVRVGRRIGL
jgi:hypothetical protein